MRTSRGIACTKLERSSLNGSTPLKALEADSRMWVEHERVLAERDRLAEEMERMAEPIAQIAQTVSRIEICDREITRLNATSTARFDHIPSRGRKRSPRSRFFFATVWLVSDAFVAVARMQFQPVVSGGAGAKDEPRVKRSASLPAPP